MLLVVRPGASSSLLFLLQTRSISLKGMGLSSVCTQCEEHSYESHSVLKRTTRLRAKDLVIIFYYSKSYRSTLCSKELVFKGRGTQSQRNEGSWSKHCNLKPVLPAVLLYLASTERLLDPNSMPRHLFRIIWRLALSAQVHI